MTTGNSTGNTIHPISRGSGTTTIVNFKGIGRGIKPASLRYFYLLKIWGGHSPTMRYNRPRI
jgi:hypothetical protein